MVVFSARERGPLTRRISLMGKVLALAVGLPVVAAAAAPVAASAWERAMAAAEASLRAGQPSVAQARYREALGTGWLLLGTLDRIDGRLDEAETAFRAAASDSAPRADEALALLLIQRGRPADAVPLLEELTARDHGNVPALRLLAQALQAAGQPERAVRTLEAARAAAPADLEIAFALADGYLGMKDVGRAARLFAQILEARPLPQTRLLAGAAYRRAGEYARAEGEFRAALKEDPRLRRAHYSLAMTILDQKGKAGIESAVPELQAEIALAPDDPLANLELGVALVEGQRSAEAVPALALAARTGPPSARTFYYLGRAQVAAGQAADAATSLRRALDLSKEQGGSAHALRGIHIQLGQALRALGQADESAVEFAEAARLSGQEAGAERDQLARYMSDAVESRALAAPVPVMESTPLAEMPATERQELTQRVRAALTRAHLNLGVIEAQGQRFAEAAALFEKAAALDPDFPQVQSSLGIAYFNAREFAKATGPLTRAVAAAPAPGDRGLTRMLALAWLNSESYAKAAALLQDDPDREADPSLEFAYGLALVKSDRAAEAEAVFSRLLRAHGDSAELSVFLGQAHAQQGDFAAAIESLDRARKLKPDVAEASATLGVIYLRQGRLPEAESALRAELKDHPADLTAQQNLATVLDLQQRGDEAVPLLRAVVQARPDLSDPRYLLGKILLAQGAVAEAVEQLKTAAALGPNEANIHYQLGKAYQKAGQAELAEQEFARFREIKAGSKP
jgi:tetratricopeptide (TPR) repeat protein